MRVGSGTSRLPTALSSLRNPPLGLKASPRMRVGYGTSVSRLSRGSRLQRRQSGAVPACPRGHPSGWPSAAGAKSMALDPASHDHAAACRAACAGAPQSMQPVKALCKSDSWPRRRRWLDDVTSRAQRAWRSIQTVTTVLRHAAQPAPGRRSQCNPLRHFWQIGLVAETAALPGRRDKSGAKSVALDPDSHDRAAPPWPRAAPRSGRGNWPRSSPGCAARARDGQCGSRAPVCRCASRGARATPRSARCAGAARARQCLSSSSWCASLHLRLATAAFDRGNRRAFGGVLELFNSGATTSKCWLRTWDSERYDEEGERWVVTPYGHWYSLKSSTDTTMKATITFTGGGKLDGHTLCAAAAPSSGKRAGRCPEM
jgi:hypothetical protein